MTPISIHAPREGSDHPGRDRPGGIQISIHAPREGSDNLASLSISGGKLFLSTLPARGATEQTSMASFAAAISIHAPREGSDFFTTSIPPKVD